MKQSKQSELSPKQSKRPGAGYGFMTRAGFVIPMIERRSSLPSKAPLLDASILGDRRQRRLLDILRDRSLPLTERGLAVELAAREEDKPPADVTTEERRQRQLRLHHQDLPEFEAAGLIERRPDGVVSTEQFPLPEPNPPLPHIPGLDDPSGEELATLLSRPRRQDVVSLVVERDRPLALDEIAAELATSERRTASADDPVDESSLRITLHHVDLPKLDDIGLIEYDSDEKTVSPTPR